jgi:hypothetical protein
MVIVENARKNRHFLCLAAANMPQIGVKIAQFTNDSGSHLFDPHVLDIGPSALLPSRSEEEVILQKLKVIT